MENNESIFNNVDERFFFELINDFGDSSTYSELMKVYLTLIAKKLTSDTKVSFHREGDHSITNDKLGIRIKAIDTLDYDDLLDDIDNELGGDDDSVRYENQLIDDWSYRLDSVPYFDTEKHLWKAYNDYGQNVVFDIIYYGLYRTYDKKSFIGYDLEKKYLIESEDWSKPKYYKGHIDELNIDVSFAKNGNMRITSKMPKEFWETIENFYAIVDPNGRHHSRQY